MNRWTASSAIAAGGTLLTLYALDVIVTVPYSIFAIMAGATLIVEGTRSLLNLRRAQDHQSQSPQAPT
ncbi:hypothetical protein AB0M39_01450 [Streptomyces sp. NPDC051907]|uniref:hypothetical protein n=1 Tax=Streptomyces sp. NPDC051907 TaxID=3155284 RepID=UPI003428124F